MFSEIKRLPGTLQEHNNTSYDVDLKASISVISTLYMLLISIINFVLDAKSPGSEQRLSDHRPRIPVSTFSHKLPLNL